MHRAYLILVPISLLLLIICGSILYLELAPAKVEGMNATGARKAGNCFFISRTVSQL